MYKDERGLLSHLGDLQLPNIKRVYFISGGQANGFRGWHGHRFESKIFYCISGSATVWCARPSSWDQTVESEDDTVLKWDLRANSPGFLFVPEGYANGIEMGGEASTLMVMSNRSLGESQSDDYRFLDDRWLRG